MPNAGTQGVLRVWPLVGVWEVSLARLVYGDLGCRLLTGQPNQSSGERYAWGFRWRDQEGYALVIIDSNQQAVTAQAIKLFVDQIPIGSYAIIRRFGPQSGIYSVVAGLPPGDHEKIMSLIKLGGSVNFATDAFTYSASLQGAEQGVGNLQACILEVSHLNAANPKANQPDRSKN